MKYQNTYERRIEAKELLCRILRQWRWILWTALVLGLLLGSSQVLRYFQSRTVNPSEQAQYEAAQAKYESDLAYYDNAISQQQKKAENQEKYLTESVKMGLDSENLAWMQATLYVRMEDNLWETYQGNAEKDLADSVIRALTASLTRQVDWSDLEAQLGIEAKYLEELVWVYPDYDFDFIIVETYSNDFQTSEVIMKELCRQIEMDRPAITAGIGPYVVTEVNACQATVSSPNIYDAQRQARDSLEEYQTELEKLEQEKSELVKPAVPAAMSGKGMLKRAVVFGAAGCLLGAALVVVVCFLKYAWSRRLCTASEMRDGFGCRVLGDCGRPSAGGKTGIDRWVDRIQYKDVYTSEEEALKMAGAGLRSLAEKDKTLLVTGTVSEELLQRVAERISGDLSSCLILETGADPTRHPQTACLLHKCDGVLLVEKKGTSELAAIRRELAYLDELDKPVVGCVVL